MANELLINVSPVESRVALLENGNVVELYIEREAESSLIGNIYKGRVIKVLPGMGAAFVDIGLERSAFLYVGDVVEHYDDFYTEWRKDDNGGNHLTLAASCVCPHHVPIEDILQEGQEVLVQVAKPPLCGKGARLTSHITLPGRNLVLMPTVNHVGVSRRITDEGERQRLKEALAAIKPPDCGLIARTASEGLPVDKLQDELEFLLQIWKNILKKKETAPTPSLLHRELDIVLRVVRDLFTKEVDRLIVDDVDTHAKILSFVESFQPWLKMNLELYQGPEPLFDCYDIEIELQRALGKKVWLKSGGYIIIEPTEALVVIDVNTGRYVGKHNLEETILKTNLEAVKEIAYQLRLRNIGGLIVIDFIDMEKEANRERVYNALKEAMKKDRAKTSILKMSELGLVEMTRQRSRESLHHMLTEPCPYCDQKGFIRSRTSVAFDILRELTAMFPTLGGEQVTVEVHPELANVLLDLGSTVLEQLEKAYGCKIVIVNNPTFHWEKYAISY
ncbi:MAG: Rne/Rng family ribonuclease [Desulfobacca sp.]|uniref:Rne/Rng family ribonuclease n=1 Tax=Desulfobacca sp. TaxID=2067990 RepID=UPI00404A797D